MFLFIQRELTHVRGPLRSSHLSYCITKAKALHGANTTYADFAPQPNPNGCLHSLTPSLPASARRLSLFVWSFEVLTSLSRVKIHISLQAFDLFVWELVARPPVQSLFPFRKVTPEDSRTACLSYATYYPRPAVRNSCFPSPIPTQGRQK